MFVCVCVCWGLGFKVGGQVLVGCKVRSGDARCEDFFFGGGLCFESNQRRCHETGVLNFSLPLQYGIVIDSGSSRSTVYVYSWPGEKQNETGVVTETMNCRVAGESWLFGGEVERRGGQRFALTGHGSRSQFASFACVWKRGYFGRTPKGTGKNRQTLCRQA